MCLASPRASEIPLADMSVKLQRAGLGEKELSIPVTADAAEVHDIIVDAFPVLKNTGYELLRTMGHGNKDFTLIGQVSSADVLKVGLKKAKCYLLFTQSIPLSLDNTIGASPTDVFIFVTGSRSVPPTGMKSWTVKFTDKSVVPSAHTCNLVLTLPTAHSNDKETFFKNLTLGFLSHSFFGQA